ncbi:hypothetical protein RJZ56_005493 [Blastomyces dermatitidis]
MPAPSRPSFLSLSKSPSFAISPPSHTEPPELLSSDSNQPKSDPSASIAASQTPVSLSIILSNLIPSVLILIYAIYIIHRIRRYTRFAGIKRFFHICVSLPQNTMDIVWRGRRRGIDGYVHVDANQNSDHSVERGGWDELASYGVNGHEEIEIEGQQDVAGTGRPVESKGYQQGDQLIDSLSSGFDASDAALDTPLEDDGEEQLDMSRYFDPMTSRLREGVLFDPEIEIGREDKAEFEGKGEKGDITAWIDGAVGRVVARFVSWLDD